MTSDGSMWVWIPRYAYKITSGYHTATSGTIEIKFLKGATNEFWDGSNETILSDPSQVTYTEDAQNEWLVHPAFLSDPNIGGGFGMKSSNEDGITGLWFAKFETSGDLETGLKSVCLADSLGGPTIGTWYKAARQQTFGESRETADMVDGFNYAGFSQSHMVKNSEWGAVGYLTYSKFGANKEIISRNYGRKTGNALASGYMEVYTKYANSSTTKNAYGIYDMVGCRWELVASYVGTEKETFLEFGLGMITEENKNISSRYKTVYSIGSTDDSNPNFLANSRFKGDAIWEVTSYNWTSNKPQWYDSQFFYPWSSCSAFLRSSYWGWRRNV